MVTDTIKISILKEQLWELECSQILLDEMDNF